MKYAQKKLNDRSTDKYFRPSNHLNVTDIQRDPTHFLFHTSVPFQSHMSRLLSRFLNLASCWLDLVKNSVTPVVDVTVTRQVFFALTYSLKLLPSSNVKQLHTKFASSFLFPFGIFS